MRQNLALREELVVQGSYADEGDANRQRPTLALRVNAGQIGSDPVNHFVLIGGASHIDREMRPARTVERQRSDVDDASIFDGDAHRTLGANFAHAAPLQVAGKHDPRIAADNLRGVDMPQRPVVVAEAPKIIYCARRITVWSTLAIERRVQPAQVQPAVTPGGIGFDEF